MSVDAQDYWFNGPVAEAIGLVGQRNCVLLVYIYDDSEKSETLDKTLNDAELGSLIKEKTVALRMKKDSENANMFGQRYPTIHTPIVYLIQQGTIRDFVIETVTKQELLDKLNSIVTPIISSSIHTQPAQQQQQQQQQEISAQQQQQSDDSNTNEQHSSSPIIDSPSTATASPITATTATTSVLDEAEKKEKIRKQLAEARKLREEREKQEAKEREIKRREQGRELEKAKQDRIDRENKVYFDKIKKERKADEEHKKKVREQIARDRAEKIAARKAEKERQVSIDSNEEQQQSGSSGSKQQSYNTCNLNIRQLDGSTIRNQFNADNTLSSVREWINENRTDGSHLYRLSAQFPTRIFTESDDGELLSSLNLCPSATIIMKPAKKKGNVISDSSSPNMIVGFASSSFNFIYSLIFNIFQIITGLLSTLFPRNGLATTPENDNQQQQQLRSLRGGQRLGGESSSTASASSSATRRRNPYSTRVNTLHEDEDEGNGKDDDGKKTTYNGNSVNHE